MKTINFNLRQFIPPFNKRIESAKETDSFSGNAAPNSYARKLKRNFMLKRLWLYPVCCALVYLLSGEFLVNTALRLASTPLLASILFHSVIRVLYGKRSGYLRSQSKVLFQSLCTGVSGGYSLESAFLAARPSVESVFGKKSILGHSLREMEKERSAQVPFSDSLSRVCLRMDYMEIYPIMQALAITRVVGNGIISILRNSCQMISELIAVSQEVDANNAGKNAEAAILCIMPYAITFTLTSFTGEYMLQAKETPLGTMILIAAFCLSIVSCGLLLRLVGDNKQIGKKYRAEGRFCLSFPSKITDKLRRLQIRIFSDGYISREYERAAELSHDSAVYLRRKNQRLLTGIVIFFPTAALLLFLLALPPVLLLLAPFLPYLYIHLKEKEMVRIRRESLMEDIPLFLAILTTLLQSGVLLTKSIQICSEAFSKKSVLGKELTWMKQQIASGISSAQAIEEFSERTPIPEAQAALLLAARYERRGGLEVIQLLTLQANACWNLCRNASRKRKERDAVQMILPMMLDLISVLLVVMTPAILSLQTH